MLSRKHCKVRGFDHHICAWFLLILECCCTVDGSGLLSNWASMSPSRLAGACPSPHSYIMSPVNLASRLWGLATWNPMGRRIFLLLEGVSLRCLHLVCLVSNVSVVRNMVSRTVSLFTPRPCVLDLYSRPPTLHVFLNASELEAHFPIGRLICRTIAVSW